MKKRMLLALLLLALILPLAACGGPEGTYKQAQDLLSKGKFTEAAEKFESIGSYEDAATLAIYCKACALCEAGNFETGITALERLGDYKDSALRVTYYTARYWDAASLNTTEFEKMERAKNIYNENSLYLDSVERITALDQRIEKAKADLYAAAVDAGENGDYSYAQYIFDLLDTYQDSQKRCTYYGIRADERALTADAHENAVFAVAKKYAAMGAFLDAADRAAALNTQVNTILAKKYQIATIGGYVTVGAYEQDNIVSNGKEPIEWLVLAKTNDRLLVISRYALDCKPYNTVWIDITWENSTLRTWLNNDFVNTAFSSIEQSMIPIATVPAYKNPSNNADPGNATQDKVFLLSRTEIEQYFSSDNSAKCQATAYAESQGTVTNSEEFCEWFLRSPGGKQNYVAYVDMRGNSDGGVSAIYDLAGVRPAMWIDLNP